MTERQNYDKRLAAIGEYLMEQRKSLGMPYKSREAFISNRSDELFGGEDWISIRHLANLELGKNWLSVEMLLDLATALELKPEDLFAEIIRRYRENDSL